MNSHDRQTRGHCERVRAYACLIAKEMGLSANDRDLLNWSSLLHDIGKLTIPAELLNKKGKLTQEEFAIVKRHPEAGVELVRPLTGWLGPWAKAVGEHHERVDGAGYPKGLNGGEISTSGPHRRRRRRL